MESTIFIENLRRNIDVAKLCDAFRIYGNIVSANIVCDDDMKPIGEAFISFQDGASALNSVKYMDGSSKLGSSIRVCLSVEKEHYRKVFVKNFSRKWDLCDLYKAFEDIGDIEDAVISEDNNGKSNGYGYITFTTHSGAMKAIQCMNGKICGEYKLVVERFKRRSERENLQKNSLEYAEAMLKKATDPTNLHVKNLPRNITEDELKQLFAKCGEISSIKIVVDGSGISKGFGFVSYKSKEAAYKAYKKMNGLLLNGKNIVVSFKQDGHARKHFMDLKNKDKEVKIKQYKHRSQSTSSLKFLPHSLISSNFKN